MTDPFLTRADINRHVTPAEAAARLIELRGSRALACEWAIILVAEMTGANHAALAAWWQEVADLLTTTEAH